MEGGFNHADSQPSDVQSSRSKTTTANASPRDVWNHAAHTPECGTGKAMEGNNKNPDPAFDTPSSGINPR